MGGSLKIGYVTPAVIRLPWALEAYRPDGVEILCEGLGVPAYSADAFDAAARRGTAAVRRLAVAGALSVGVSGAPLAAFRGRRAEAKRLAAWSIRAGVPVNSGLAAATSQLLAAGASATILASAYRPDVAAQVQRYVVEAGMGGIQVIDVVALGASHPDASRSITPDQHLQAMRASLRRHRDADSVLLAAPGDLRMVTSGLMQDDGVTVVDQVSALLAWAVEVAASRTGLVGPS